MPLGPAAEDQRGVDAAEGEIVVHDIAGVESATIAGNIIQFRPAVSEKRLAATSSGTSATS